MNKHIKELAQRSGFRVFGEKIVAADQGSSGLATESLARFSQLLLQEILDITEPMPGSGDIDDLVLARVQKEIKERFFSENIGI